MAYEGQFDFLRNALRMMAGSQNPDAFARDQAARGIPPPNLQQNGGMPGNGPPMKTAPPQPRMGPTSPYPAPFQGPSPAAGSLAASGIGSPPPLAASLAPTAGPQVPGTELSPFAGLSAPPGVGGSGANQPYVSTPGAPARGQIDLESPLIKMLMAGLGGSQIPGMQQQGPMNLGSLLRGIGR